MAAPSRTKLKWNVFLFQASHTWAVNELDKRKTLQIRDDLKSVKPSINGVKFKIRNNVKKSKRKEMRGLARRA